MNQRRFTTGVLLLLLAAVCWGGMFPVAKATLAVLDAFYMTTLRYGITALILLAILVRIEGPRALILEGRAGKVLLYGSLGFAGFSLLAFEGLARSRPEHGAVIMALMPLITALVNWALKGVRPARFTLGAIAAALAGVFLVITDGQPGRALAGGQGLGDLLLLAGAVSWVLYTVGAGDFPAWSALRYTALTCTLGVGTILAATGIATAAGYIHAPTLAAVGAVRWELAYLIAFASVIAVLSWNWGIKQVGAINGVLFINFVPVTAFAIGLAQGQHFDAVELLGAALVIGALVANNLHARWTSPVVPLGARDNA